MLASGATVAVPPAAQSMIVSPAGRTSRLGSQGRAASTPSMVTFTSAIAGILLLHLGPTAAGNGECNFYGYREVTWTENVGHAVKSEYTLEVETTAADVETCARLCDELAGAEPPCTGFAFLTSGGAGRARRLSSEFAAGPAIIEAGRFPSVSNVVKSGATQGLRNSRSVGGLASSDGSPSVSPSNSPSGSPSGSPTMQGTATMQGCTCLDEWPEPENLGQCQGDKKRHRGCGMKTPCDGDFKCDQYVTWCFVQGTNCGYRGEPLGEGFGRLDGMEGQETWMWDYCNPSDMGKCAALVSPARTLLAPDSYQCFGTPRNTPT